MYNRETRDADRHNSLTDALDIRRATGIAYWQTVVKGVLSYDDPIIKSGSDIELAQKQNQCFCAFKCYAGLLCTMCTVAVVHSEQQEQPTDRMFSERSSQLQQPNSLVNHSGLRHKVVQTAISHILNINWLKY